MRIAITGTRGIPNRYGGFEQFAEKVSVALLKRGHEVWVYTPHFHPYRSDHFEGVRLRRMRLPEKLFGPAANYAYDFRCIRHAIRLQADIILECGFASAAPFYRMLDFRKSRIITHMDGMEWLRSKWSRPVRRIIYHAQFAAVQYSDAIVCDNQKIFDYYREKFGIDPAFISYGATIKEEESIRRLHSLDLAPRQYFLLIARLEPENNIRTVIEGYLSSGHPHPLLIIGNAGGKYGRKIRQDYVSQPKIHFLGEKYHPPTLDALRYHAMAVFHGHSVGGTNPSLLEAMAARSFLIAHRNPFNQDVLGGDAHYFSQEQEIGELLRDIESARTHAETWIRNNFMKIKKLYRWEIVADKYEALFNELLDQAL